MEGMNSYDGPGFVGAGAGKPQKRDGVRLTHREVMSKFRKIGDEALNAGDYERTMHLPIGKGRLAADPETGDFDKDAERPRYDPSRHPFYPRFVHSTITEGEQLVVEDGNDHEKALATRKWADKPLERKKRFVLTEADQLMSMKGELLGERAARLDMERRLEAGVFGESPEAKENASVLAIQLGQQKEMLDKQQETINLLLSRLESLAVQAPEEVPTATGKSRRELQK